jgi:hypothetical protein
MNRSKRATPPKMTAAQSAKLDKRAAALARQLVNVAERIAKLELMDRCEGLFSLARAFDTFPKLVKPWWRAQLRHIKPKAPRVPRVQPDITTGWVGCT